MGFVHVKPQMPLGAFVDLLWYNESEPQPHAKERLLPTGEMELVINLNPGGCLIYDRDDPTKFESYGSAVICGAHSSHFIIDTVGQTRVIGAHFRPGGAFPFFRFPAGEIHNAHVALEDVWGGRARALRDRLLACASVEAMLAALGDALLAEAYRPLERHPAVRFALRELGHAPHVRTVTEVTKQIGLSPRRFIEAFSSEVGLTPKVYSRVRRFQEVIRRVRSGQPFEWARIAGDCGYYDQAHFIHDFRSFSGLSPTRYVAQMSQHVNHVPMTEQ